MEVGPSHLKNNPDICALLLSIGFIDYFFCPVFSSTPWLTLYLCLFLAQHLEKNVHASCLHSLTSHSLLNPLQSGAVPMAPLKLLSPRSPTTFLLNPGCFPVPHSLNSLPVTLGCDSGLALIPLHFFFSFSALPLNVPWILF